MIHRYQKTWVIQPSGCGIIVGAQKLNTHIQKKPKLMKSEIEKPKWRWQKKKSVYKHINKHDRYVDFDPVKFDYEDKNIFFAAV